MENNCCNMCQINYFFPPKHKPLRSKNVSLDMHGTLTPTSCNSWEGPMKCQYQSSFLGDTQHGQPNIDAHVQNITLNLLKKKLKTSCCIKKINYFFPSKQKSLSKNICFDMQGTLHPTSCNSWKDPWNVSINILFWGYPTWATKQWFSCSKYYIKLQFSKKKRKKKKRKKEEESFE